MIEIQIELSMRHSHGILLRIYQCEGLNNKILIKYLSGSFYL